MGFLKRIFSIGGKKNKKQGPSKSPLPQPPSIDEERRRELEEEEHEAAVGRLLRSASSRYAVVKEIDYTNLPPLPHPINDVLAQRTPKEKTPSLRASPSTLSLASSTLSRHSTFSVTVHSRQRHAMTEFPNANGELGDGSPTPVKSKSRRDGANLVVGPQPGLRSDPSVASLIELYDEHGRLPVETFSNTPPSEKYERQQKKRNGSTLRELLGAPDSSRSDADTKLESDISWAERFLGEADSVSSHNSSYGPHTPSTHSDFADGRGHASKFHDFTISSISSNNVDDPAINSMEVELSSTSDSDSIFKETSPYRSVDPSTPQRASQVFSFLTARRHTGPVEMKSPSMFGFSSIVSHDNIDAHLSSGFASPRPRKSQVSQNVFSDTCETPKQIVDTTTEDADDATPGPRQRKVRVLMTGPTKVIVTAPTPRTDAAPSRIPVRGPRQPPKNRSSSRRTPMVTHRTNSNNSVSSRGSRRSINSTSIPQRRTYRQPPSQDRTNTPKSIAEADAMATVLALDQLARSKAHHSSPRCRDKENQIGPATNMELPATPLRNSAGRSSWLRKPVTQAMFQQPENTVPSPSSSSELSPVGKQMMVDARRRKRAREDEREVRRPIGVRI